MQQTFAAIGGYMELESGERTCARYPQALALQSGRAAFLALLLAQRPKKVWLPWYICDEMVITAQRAKVEVKRYAIDESFAVANDIGLASGEWLVYVNYFGLCDRQVDAALTRFPPEQVIVDDSHAFFSEPRDCLATIYSPRKFVGVPDGGYLVSRIAVPEPEEEDTESVSRCRPLLVRAADSAEAGYAEYLKSQESFARQPPLRMSRLTQGFLQSIDYAAAAQARRANFDALAAVLDGSNTVALRRDGTAVPLSYPYLRPGNAKLRELLLRHRVYAPNYWAYLADPKSAGVPAFERHLAVNCLPLPCDQRYAAVDMARISGLVSGQLGPDTSEGTS